MLSGVRPGVFGAAGLLRGREFHEFDAGVVGIVEVKLPFAVATHLGLSVAAPTVLAKLLLRRVDVRDSESHVVHDAESVMVSVGGNVEHVFDPVGAIGDLHVDPAGFVVFPPTMPVDVEAENIFIEAVFGGAIVNDKAGVDHSRADMVRGGLPVCIQFGLEKSDAVSFRIDRSKVLPWPLVSRELTYLDTILLKNGAQRIRVVCLKRDREEVIGLASSFGWARGLRVYGLIW